MATKTFKIGLSNTDKQNMAQDVYERLLALTFPEYDTTTSYEVGDFVVYNDQLYKCIGATSGAWDSTKWQLATLNDLLTDIESAVAFVNDKANVDGNYPTMTVGVADQLSPYDDESGDDQDEPFSFQATGTGNGTQPDFSTGAIALMKEKQGNTVVVNQLVQNGNFVNTDNWGAIGGGGTVSTSENVLTLSITDTSGIIQSKTGKIQGHKYLVSYDINTSFAGKTRVLWTGGAESWLVGSSSIDIAANSWHTISGIYTMNVTNDVGGSIYFYCYNTNLTSGTAKYRNVILVDLTQWFNGDIPQDLLDNPSNFFRYYQGSLAYNTGELVNANGRYVKCIGMNQWDEEWESGGLKNDGTLDDNGARRTTSFIRVNPNCSYYQKCPTSAGSGRFAYYDANKNLILFSDFGLHSNDTFTTPSNACFLRITFGVSYGTTYNHDISINLYYEDEARCLTYEPYEVLTNNDTGTEILRSAGSVKDYKTPDGTIHRLVGYVKLADLDFDTYSSPASGIFRIHINELPNIKQPQYNYQLINAVCPPYTQKNYQNISGSDNLCFAVSTTENNRTVFINTSYNSVDAFKSAMANVYLYYELAEPTTEQGTSYSENLVIDDFGSMDFQGTNGVPQGNLIFYPVDYKAFIDTLYNYTDGTPSELALKSDLASDKSELQGVDTQLKNAIGGTLRQCLCVKESLDFEDTDFVDLGTLTWSSQTIDGVNWFYSNGIAGTVKEFSNSEVAKAICTLYSVVSANTQAGLGQQDTFSIGNIFGSKYINIKDNSYSDATTFKNAMKGVLLAYEKESA